MENMLGNQHGGNSMVNACLAEGMLLSSHILLGSKAVVSGVMHAKS